jgi:pilus assembly protein CpaC
VQLLLQALKTENLAKLLAGPKLVTQSGRPARFLAGGRQATLGASSGINGPGVVYEDIGTELEFLPIVYGNGKIYLEVAPRVRGVNQGLGIITSFGAVPGFDEQSIRTSVVLESGQTFAIGGLIQTVGSATATKVPLLGELPFFGTLFSQETWLEQEQELVILVTPHLVDAMDCNQVPKRLPGRESRSPDDFELYLEGILELPRGQRNVFEGKHYLAPWKVDPTASAFPCGVVNYGYGIHGHKGIGDAGCNTGACGTIKGGNGIGSENAPNKTATELPPAVNVPKEMPPVKVSTGAK